MDALGGTGTRVEWRGITPACPAAELFSTYSLTHTLSYYPLPSSWCVYLDDILCIVGLLFVVVVVADICC
jgi:hypothetical protein